MNEVDKKPLTRWRPRLSLLSALVLMTIVGMAIVVVQLWREVRPLRAEVKQLRDETGRLHVEDKSQLCAVRVDTKDELTWKWRIWVPENRQYALKVTGENIPKQGIPQNHGMMSIHEPGERVVVFRIQRDRRSYQWYGVLHYSSGHVGNYNQPWIDWPTRTSEEESVGYQTVVAKAGGSFVLMRKLVSKASDSSKIENPAAGFMIWIDPVK